MELKGIENRSEVCTVFHAGSDLRGKGAIRQQIEFPDKEFVSVGETKRFRTI
jgi:hypothetical protein